MEKIISEIVIGALFLAMLGACIPLYSANKAIIEEAAETVDYNEKIKKTAYTEPETGTWITGTEVITAIRYFAVSGSATIEIRSSRGYKFYNGDEYEEDVFTVDRSKKHYCIKSVINGKNNFTFIEGV